MAKMRKFSVSVPKHLPCACGGLMKPVKQTGKYDATAELGISAEVKGTWVAVKCDHCARIALPGRMLEVLSEEAVLLILQLDRCVSGQEAKFLRKAALTISQAELAELLGMTRVTVARWEGSRSLSPEHDFQLRGLVTGRLVKNSRLGPSVWKSRRSQLIDLLPGVLAGARTQAAPARPPPLRIAA